MIFFEFFPALGLSHQPIILIASGHVVLTTIKTVKRFVYDVRVGNIQIFGIYRLSKWNCSMANVRVSLNKFALWHSMGTKFQWECQ